MNLDNKTLVVMGAGGRLGQVIVEAILKEGGHVAAIDSHPETVEKLQSKYKGNDRVLCLQGDMTESVSLQQNLNQVAQYFTQIDGAVNTAYPRNSHYGQPFLEVTYESFSENLSLHLGGYFLFMQQCVKYALTSKSNFSLVNLSSIYGCIAPRFELYEDTAMTMPVEYAAIKSALLHLVKYVTAYTKGSKFRVNCVSPGGILADQDQQFLQRYNHYCREKGMLEPKDVVGAILFLLSDDSNFICGQNIIIDDGFHL
jgi:NAD(P)-dependent dehydrogenase (short-subunit alcohol dehydrogenase family)